MVSEVFFEELSTKVEDISVYSIILPLLVGLFYFKFLNKLLKQFLFFLVYAGLVDQYCTYIFSSNPVFNIYRLTEGMFYVYILYSILDKQRLIFYLILVEAFLVFLFLYTHLAILKNYDLQSLNPLYDRIAGILLSSVSAVIILYMSEKNNKLQTNSQFWFCTGIFIYSFCTNFVFSLIDNKRVEKFWFLHDFINILTYLIFTVGFLATSKTKTLDTIKKPARL